MEFIEKTQDDNKVVSEIIRGLGLYRIKRDCEIVLLEACSLWIRI